MLRDDVEEAAAIFESRLDAPFRSFPLESSAVPSVGTAGSASSKKAPRSAASMSVGSAPCRAEGHCARALSIGMCKALDRTPCVDWMLRHESVLA